MVLICCKYRIESIRNRKKPKRITKTKVFINKYNCSKINFPSEKDHWKKIEKIM